MYINRFCFWVCVQNRFTVYLPVKWKCFTKFVANCNLIVFVFFLSSNFLVFCIIPAVCCLASFSFCFICWQSSIMANTCVSTSLNLFLRWSKHSCFCIVCYIVCYILGLVGLFVCLFVCLLVCLLFVSVSVRVEVGLGLGLRLG